MLEFPEGTLAQSGEFLVNVLNKFLLSLPEKDTKVGQRLVIQILEEADVASQKVIAQAYGLSQARSLRRYKQALREEGLAGLFDRPRSGRPAITTQPAVEQALMELILEALLKEQTLPDDETLAQKMNDSLVTSQTQKITPSMVQSIRLRLGIKRVKIRQLLAIDQGGQVPVLPSLLTLDRQVDQKEQNKELSSCPKVSAQREPTSIEMSQEKKHTGLLGKPETSKEDRAIQTFHILIQKQKYLPFLLPLVSRFPPIIFTNCLIYLFLAPDLVRYTKRPDSDVQHTSADARVVKTNDARNSSLLPRAPAGPQDAKGISHPLENRAWFI